MTTLLNVLAVFFAGRGVMNLLKRFGTGSGFVFLGHLLPPDTPLALVFGVAMIAYGWGLWRRAGWAIPLGVVYSLFATANLILFTRYQALPAWVAWWMWAVYQVGGIAMSWASVWLLVRERSRGRVG